MNHCERGREAERLAARYLEERGYRIWKANWRWGRKELDLVAVRGGELVIIEVKLQDGNTVNDPSHVVDVRKQRHIIQAAEAFIRLHHSSRPTRFDVVAVIRKGGQTFIEHTENAFSPGVE